MKPTRKWHQKTDVPSDDRTVVICTDDNGVPQCLSFAYYNHEQKKWIDLLQDFDEDPRQEEDIDEPVFDYWMDLLPLTHRD